MDKTKRDRHPPSDTILMYDRNIIDEYENIYVNGDKMEKI
jgi:hypothetical protein